MKITTCPEGTFIEVDVSPTIYRVSLLDPDDHESFAWDVTVEWRGLRDNMDTFAVCHFTKCLSNHRDPFSCTWDYEPSPSNREDNWLATHRFTAWDTAINHAVTLAPFITVNGLSAKQRLERFRARKRGEEVKPWNE